MATCKHCKPQPDGFHGYCKHSEARPGETCILNVEDAVCSDAQRGLYELGRIREKSDLQSAKDLRQLVLTTSKAILTDLPCPQFEDDAIEELDSNYSHTLTKMQETRL